MRCGQRVTTIGATEPPPARSYTCASRPAGALLRADLLRERQMAMIPGEWLLAEEPIEINAGKRTLRLTVRNTGDRPIQIGSHFHFFEVNRALEFDRQAALGMR